MRKLFLPLLAVLALTLSCKNDKKGDIPSASLLLPSDTWLAVKIQPGSIIDHTGLKDNEKFFKLLNDEAPEDAAALIGGFIKDPSSSGIDAEASTFLSISGDSKIHVFVPLVDAEKFSKFLEKLDAPVKAAKGKDWLYYLGDNEKRTDGVILKNLAILSVEETSASALAEMAKGDGKGIEAESFASFSALDKGIALWMDVEKANEKADLDSETRQMMAMLGQSYVIGTLNSGKGSLDCDFHVDLDPEVRKEVDPISLSIYREAGNDYFKYMPADPLFVVNIGLENLKDLVETLVPLYDPEGLKEIDEGLAESGMTRDDLAAFFGGPVTVAGSVTLKDNTRYDWVSEEYVVESEPTFSIAGAFGCRKPLAEFMDETLPATLDGAYFIDLDEGDGAYLTQSDGVAVVMTPDLHGLASKDRTLPANLSGNEFSRKVIPNGITVNLKSSSFKALIQTAMEEEDVPAFISKEIVKTLGFLDYATFSVDPKDYTVGISVRSDKDDEFFLKTAIDASFKLVEIASKFM